MSLDNLKEKILFCLENFEITRNDDAQLTFFIIHKYLPNEIIQVEGKWFISTEALKQVREDNVKRLRAIVQNLEHRFLPTTEEVRKKRKIGEQEWRIYLANL